jgi:hypothetical protein
MSARSSIPALALLVLAGCNAADRSPNAAQPQGNAVASAPLKPADRPRADNKQEPAASRLDEVDASTNAAAPARDPQAVERDWFAGRWTDTGDCADAAHFAANGTYLLANGIRGMWNVQDSRLVVQNASGRATVRLRRVSDDAVETVGEDGSVGRSTRC